MTTTTAPTTALGLTAPLGTIYLPANPGTPVGEFRFIVDRDAGNDVVIGTPVAADTSEGTVIGTVTDLLTIGSDRDPINADYAATNSEHAPPAERTDVIVGVVQIFHSERRRPVPAGRVRPSTAVEMLKASGVDHIDWPIPAGVVPLADGSYAKICLDGHDVLGPESAHVVTGGRRERTPGRRRAFPGG